MKTIPLSFNFPILKYECLFFIFTSPKRVTNTHCSSSNDESILTCFTNLRKEGFIPRKGLSSFDFMSPMKVNIVSFMFRESKRGHKETPKRSFFVNSHSRSKKEINYYRLVDRFDTFTCMNVTSSLGNLFVFLRRLKRA